jgi:hypothetical protein
VTSRNPYRSEPLSEGRVEDAADEVASERSPEAVFFAANFTLSLQERVRALDGPPAYMRRLRSIEDLEERLTRNVAAIEARVASAHDYGRRLGEDADARVERGNALRARERRERRVDEDLRRMNELIESHNRHYPVEANLPIDPRTGGLLERDGRPFRTKVVATYETFVERVRAPR